MLHISRVVASSSDLWYLWTFAESTAWSINPNKSQMCNSKYEWGHAVVTCWSDEFDCRNDVRERADPNQSCSFLRFVMRMMSCNSVHGLVLSCTKRCPTWAWRIADWTCIILTTDKMLRSQIARTPTCSFGHCASVDHITHLSELLRAPHSLLTTNRLKKQPINPLFARVSGHHILDSWCVVLDS